MSHVGLSVVDLKRSVKFYRDVLGMELMDEGVFGGERYETMLRLQGVAGRIASLRCADVAIELFEFAVPAPQSCNQPRRICDHGISHFCIEVVDIESEYARLLAAGVVFHSPPLRFPGPIRATYGRDPDGNVFELIERS